MLLPIEEPKPGDPPDQLDETICAAVSPHKSTGVPETVTFHILTVPLKACPICTMLRPAAVPNPAGGTTRCLLISRAPSSLLAFWLLSLLLGLCQSAENKCSSSNASTCTKCLALGPECGWCTQEDFMVDSAESERCDTVFNLKSKGCRAEMVEHPAVQLQVVNAKETNSQVTPTEVTAYLRPGAKVSFLVRAHRLEKYPLDLYYLVDVSASMSASIEKLNSIGSDLSEKMADFSHDIRFGFGSFVDKPVSPYISVHPDRLKNQCRDYKLNCIPPHGFIHGLSLTSNVTQFKQIVGDQKISANIDNPEASFDAMLQAAVCHKDIGWRKEAKRLIIMMTDQTSHLALDSKLAGIVTPNDGNCHLKDNVYIRATAMEYPSLGLLGQRLLDNQIFGVFAVRGEAFHWYKDLVPMLPGTIAKQFDSAASNINSLVVEAYKALISEMKIQAYNPVKGISVNITAICPDGERRSGVDGCHDVKNNEKVLFNVTITMDSCDVGGGQNYIILKPIGFNETVKIKIHRTCTCQCNGPLRPKEPCITEVHPDCPGVPCRDNNCSSGESAYLPESCKHSPSEAHCSGRGACLCGKCYCHETKLGKIYGKYCEMDDFSCPYYKGKLCSGNGECRNGDCRCFKGWEGDRCQCSSSKKQCMDANGLVCSGRGTCTCGTCECSDGESFGPLCQYCSGCSNTCTGNWNCEHTHGSLNGSKNPINPYKTICNTLVYYMDQSSECFSDPWVLKIFFITFTATFLLGFLTVLIIRVIVLQYSDNRSTSSSDYRVSTSMKDKNGLHNVYSSTVTYTREKPDDINISNGTFAPHEAVKYNFEEKKHVY
ncbi:integrin beta-8 isoform X2 [Hyperolius riggenbachi]|uniref:integrin beta-8 isoform X2 n=1 Tax=Hyperolius riggenbachi TaxID=752182 RepID=UPI0035A2D373